jgi:putative transposase
MERKPYPSDLTDAQWELIEPHIPPEKWGGRTREVKMREVFNGLLYLSRTGCQWRYIPKDLPNWNTVRHYYDRFRDDGTWERVHDLLRVEVRLAAGKEPTPSAAVLDSQSVKTTEKRGSAAGTMRGRRSAAASGTSWSTRWA